MGQREVLSVHEFSVLSSPSPPRHLDHHCCYCRLFQAKTDKRPEGKTHNRLLDGAILVRGSFSWLKASKIMGISPFEVYC